MAGLGFGGLWLSQGEWFYTAVPRSFEDLLDEAMEVPVDGWDFSWLDGRATEERPSWGYQRLLAGKLAMSTAALEIQTGGGEVLAGHSAHDRT